MGAELGRLNQRWVREGLPAGRMRVGLSTGPVVVGLLGSSDRLKYTSVGDTVNVAARLESFDREGFGEEAGAPVFRVLATAETVRRLGDGFETEPLGTHPLRGRASSVAIHRIRGLASGAAGGPG
jgi:class 3 adenylate cyclase